VYKSNGEATGQVMGITSLLRLLFDFGKQCKTPVYIFLVGERCYSLKTGLKTPGEEHPY